MKTVINVNTPVSHFAENGTTFTQYLKDIRKYDILTPEEEHDLCVRARENNDEEAREKLITSNLKFVVSVAKRFAVSDNIQDLVQMGSMGLMQAIDKFDYKRVGEDGKPLRFLSCAVWYIRREIAFYLLSDNLVRRTNNVKTTQKVTKIKNNFYLENGRVPTVDEIADIIKKEYNIEIKDSSYLYDIETKHIEEANTDDKKDVFGNSALFNEKSASYNEYNDVIEQEDITYRLETLLPCLDEREKQVILELNGVKIDRPKTMEELADEIGISKERVRQIRNTALKKLRKNAQKSAVLK